MIGNDVIDLELTPTESNWKRKGFLNKIYTSKEQLFIHAAENPEVMVWSLWSRKEAAYKIFNRESKISVYNPLQFECSEMKLSEGTYSGSVTYNEIKYYTKTKITVHSIYTIAVSDENNFSKVTTLKNRDDITKIDGIPWILDVSNSTKKPASITHHGRFEEIISL